MPSTYEYNEFGPDPFEVKKITMDQVNGGEIDTLGLHMSLNNQSYYFDLKIESLTKQEKAQLYKQIHGLVYTYKELHKIIFDE